MNTKYNVIVSAAVLSLVLTVLACSDDEPSTTNPPPPGTGTCDGFKVVSFASDVKPLIDTNCAKSGCHNAGSTFDWTVFANVKAKASSIKERVSLPASDSRHMPQGGTLTDNEIKTFVCWVEQGAKDN